MENISAKPQSISVLTCVLDYIENNLCDGVTQEDIAAHCSYSISSLQKMFKHVFHLGISDYITRRRITAASKELLETDSNILDIALKYGYNSHEVFSRAFSRIWGETPSQFRRKRQFSEIYPKLDMPMMIRADEGGSYMERKRFDISELYDYLKEMDGTYIISFDIRNLMVINNTYGSPAGDTVIAECLKRIDSEKSDDMIMFRIGGDEFVLLTGTADEETARAAAEKVLSHNGECISSGGNDIPVSMRFGMMKLETSRNLRYSELFTKLVKISLSDEG